MDDKSIQESHDDSSEHFQRSGKTNHPYAKLITEKKKQMDSKYFDALGGDSLTEK